MQLNRKQQQFFDLLIKKTKGRYLIKGHAGTGKTFWAVHFILASIKNDKHVTVLCPTHVAKQQFTSKLGKVDKKLFSAETVAKFLGQIPRSTKTGELKFQKGGFGGTESHIIIVDEVSMVSEYERNEILKAAEECLVIFLGDFAQLPPVMKRFGDGYAGVKVLELTQQQRNAGPILKLCSKARNNLIFPKESIKHKSGSIVVHQTHEALVTKYLQALKKTKVPYNVTYLAYRNRTVNVVRKMAHQVLYGDEPFVKKQYVRLDQPCLIANNGDIVQILRFKRVRVKLAGIAVRVYETKIKNVGDKMIGWIRLVEPETQNELNDQLQELYEESGKAFTKNPAYWEYLQALISQIRTVTFHSSPYCSSIHKSQGRTIKRVFANTEDIANGASNKQKLSYVAYSRASVELHTVRIPNIKQKIRQQTKRRGKL